MNDFDVVVGGMGERGLNDTDIAGLIDGRPVDGAPSQLHAMVSTMREQAENGPSTPVSGALTEFIVEGVPSAAPANARSLTSPQGRSRPFAKRAAAVLAIVPAKILIGATMAAAAFGGAQAFGVVDVPLLPGPSPQIDAPAPVTVPVLNVPETTIAPALTPPVVSPDTSTHAATTIPVPPTIDKEPNVAPPSLPEQAAVDGTPGCELGQDNSAKPTQPPSDARANRPDAADRANRPATNPCGAAATPATGAPPTDPGTSPGVPASPPAENRANPSGSEPARSANSSNSGGGNVPVTTPERKAGPGRTPPSD